MSFLFAGSRTTSGYVDAIGENARFEYPVSMEKDDDYLYVVEHIGERVRRIDPYTREVTTVAVLPAGSTPYGIARHPGSGKFYIACPFNNYTTTTTTRGAIYVYNPDWSLDQWFWCGSGSNSWVIWYVWPDDDEQSVFGTGTVPGNNIGHESGNTAVPVVVHLEMATGITLQEHPAAAAFNNFGGIIRPPGDPYVYWLVGRFNNALWRASATDLSGRTSILNLDSDPTSDSGRQLHITDDGTQLLYAYGPSYNYAADAGGGSRIMSWPGMSITDPAPGPPPGMNHAGQRPSPNGAVCYETDYLKAFDAQFVASTRVTMDSGFPMYHLDGAPHSIEVYGKFPSRCSACDFEYPYRWPQFAPTLLAGAQTATIIALLAHRDRELAARLSQCGEEFDYPHQWEDIAPAFLNPDRRPEAAALLEQNDSALELHLLYRSCSIPFEYPYRWAELIGGLFDVEHSDNQRHTVAMLEERDRLLEDRLGQFP